MSQSIYKSSYYNFLIPVEEKSIFLLYNSLNGGLYELAEKQGYFISTLFDEPQFSQKEIPDEFLDLFRKLIDSQYIVNVYCNEFTIYEKMYENFRYSRVYEKGRFSITITPTLGCNLACRYCFQDPVKRRYMSDETMKNIILFLKKELDEKILINDVQKMHVTWFGGEPLLDINIIRQFSQQLIELCSGYGLGYDANLITNGTLMSPNVTAICKECEIKNIQVTLDGPAKTHNLRRPFCIVPTESYEIIMKNLENVTEDIHLTLRINCDRHVWENIDMLFDDLEYHGIWPQKAKGMNIDLAYVTRHDNARFDDSDWYFSAKEFIDRKAEFKDIKWKRYNLWASKNGRKLAKKKFRLPEIALSDCMTAINPMGLVFDTEGFIYKCWEDVDKPSRKIQHVTDPFDIENQKMSRWLQYSRLNYENCKKCKCLPICETHCTKKMIEDKRNFRCSSWKYGLEKIFREQYLEYSKNPETYAF